VGSLFLANGGGYVGEFKDGKKNGLGVLKLPDGSMVYGEFENGTFVNKDAQCMEGNCYDETSTMLFPDGSKYVGEFRNAEMNGQGTFFTNNEVRYKGEFKNCQYHGQGTYYYPEGSHYVGEWKDNKRNGHGTLMVSEGYTIAGEWKDGELSGVGTKTYNDGRVEQVMEKNHEFVKVGGEKDGK
jgi:hypothetical protein